jgi:hypothetical protein
MSSFTISSCDGGEVATTAPREGGGIDTTTSLLKSSSSGSANNSNIISDNNNSSTTNVNSTPNHPFEGDDKGSSNTSRRVIQWDEAVIEEHNKLRGTRQRIDEAPTPYNYLSESESEQSGSERGSVDFTNDPNQSAAAVHVKEGGGTSSSNRHNYSDHPSGGGGSGGLWNSEQLHAKLNYESYLQNNAGSSNSNSNNNNNSNSHSNSNSNSSNKSKMSSSSSSSNASPLKPALHHSGPSPHKSSSHVHIAPATDVQEESSHETVSAADLLNNRTVFVSPEKIKDKFDFMYKRSAHYDEFKVLKALRASDDEDENDSSSIKSNNSSNSNKNNASNSSDYNTGEDDGDDSDLNSSNEYDETAGKIKHSQAFANKRAAHYNEFNVIKALRNRHLNEESDDGEEEEEVDKKPQAGLDGK